MVVRNGLNNGNWKFRTGRGIAGGLRLACGAGVLMLTPAALAQASGTDGTSVDEPVVRTHTDAAPKTATPKNQTDSFDNDGAADGNGAPGEGNEGVQVSDYMTVDIFVQDEDLATVLQMLSMQSQRNIVASRDVVATVTANLYGVTFYEALDAILHVNGYGYIEKGNFIYVYPAEVIQQMQAEQRRIVSKVVRLNYLNSNDAAEFVAPLLSPDVGQIKTNGDVSQFVLSDNTPQGNEEFAMSSTLVIYDYPENVDEIEALLKQLDTQPAQVLVEATILQMRITEANAFGVDFSVISDLDFTDFAGLGGPLNVVNSLLGNNDDTAYSPPNNSATGVQSTPGNAAGPATLKIGIINDDFSLFVRALDEVGDTTVLSSPKILTLNRQPARVLVGRKLGYLSTTTTETSTSQTVEFLDTGTQLSFRPFISTDGMIRMELAPSVSEGFIRDNTDATGAAVTIPDEVTQEITTNVMVRDGSTVVLGGLFREETKLERRQVPFLGDIPLMGAAFRGHDDSIDRSEIIFLIKPTIMNEQVLAEESDRAYDYIERTRTGSRQGLLPWSRERQTAQLNVQAQQYYREGKMDQAMWALRRSLELNPDQPDALELREQMFHQTDVWPSRSMFQYIINDEDMTDDHFDPWTLPSDEKRSSTTKGTTNAGTTSAPAQSSAAPATATGGWFGKPFMGTPSSTGGTSADASAMGPQQPEEQQAPFGDAQGDAVEVQVGNAAPKAAPRMAFTVPSAQNSQKANAQDAAVQNQGAPAEDAFGTSSWPWLVMPFQTATTNRPAPGVAQQQQQQAPAQAQGQPAEQPAQASAAEYSQENVDYVETTGSQDEADGAVANAEDPDDE